MRNFGLLVACLCLLALAACDESSDATSEAQDIRAGSDKVISVQGEVDSATEAIEFNIMFTYPDGNEANLGKTMGLASCKKIALEHVIEKSLIMAEGWNFDCCTIEEGSQCHRKLK